MGTLSKNRDSELFTRISSEGKNNCWKFPPHHRIHLERPEWKRSLGWTDSFRTRFLGNSLSEHPTFDFCSMPRTVSWVRSSSKYWPQPAHQDGEFILMTSELSDLWSRLPNRRKRRNVGLLLSNPVTHQTTERLSCRQTRVSPSEVTLLFQGRRFFQVFSKAAQPWGCKRLIIPGAQAQPSSQRSHMVVSLVVQVDLPSINWSQRTETPPQCCRPRSRAHKCIPHIGAWSQALAEESLHIRCFTQTVTRWSLNVVFSSYPSFSRCFSSSLRNEHNRQGRQLGWTECTPGTWRIAACADDLNVLVASLPWNKFIFIDVTFIVRMMFWSISSAII